MRESLLLENGFEVVEADEPQYLEELRKNIFIIAKQIFELPGSDPMEGLNNFHRSISNLTLGDLNKKRIECIERITVECNAVEAIFKSFEQRILGLLGPDILAQKTCNLVIQPPGDPNPSELHRDAPGNSPYELVVWVPLVNCFGTKTMYILDITHSEKALDRLAENPQDWDIFEQYVKSNAKRPNVAFGQALIFHAGCLHGSDINSERDTRVSLNVRYKNLFSPSGLKNQLQFFKLLRASHVTSLGSRFEARDLQK